MGIYPVRTTVAAIGAALSLNACDRASADSNFPHMSDAKVALALGAASSAKGLPAASPPPPSPPLPRPQPAPPPPTVPDVLSPPRTLTITDLTPITVGFPDGGVVLGQGYDYVAERWIPSVCVEGQAVPLGAGELTAKYSDLQDRQQIFESIKASVSGSGSIGAASASASVDFARSVNIQIDRRNVLATIDSRRGGFQLAPKTGATSVTLVAGAMQKAKQGNLKNSNPDGKFETTGPAGAFRRTCGDGFVAAIRHGARLNMVLSYAMDSKEVKESLAIAVSGSYGTAKGKASFDRIQNESAVKENTQVSVLQVGGNRDKNPINPTEALAKISEFGKYSADDSVPLEVIVLPYRVLADIPDSILSKPLPDLGVRGLAAHYWRLSDLSSLYARASVSPQAYYSPLVSPANLAASARTLQSGAFCVAAMLDICSTNGICAMKDLVKQTRTIESCIDVQATSAEQLAVSTALAVGRKNAQIILNSAKSVDFAKLSKSKDLSPQIATALGVLESQKLPKVSVPGTLALGSATEDLWSETPYDWWYRFLARAPWPRDVRKDDKGNDIGVSDTDMTQLLMAYCKTRRLDCSNVEYSVLNNPASEVKGKPPLAGIYLDFVVNMRLYPIAASVCETQLSHPMCQLPDVLPGYITPRSKDDVPVFGDERGFYVLKTPEPPPAPTPPKPPREEPYWGCKTGPGGRGMPC